MRWNLKHRTTQPIFKKFLTYDELKEASKLLKLRESSLNVSNQQHFVKLGNKIVEQELNTNEDFKHIFETLLCYEPCIKEDLTFLTFYEQVTKKIGIEGLLFLSKEELRGLHLQHDYPSALLLDEEVVGIQSLQLYFKFLQKEGKCSPGAHFNFLTIGSEDFMNYLHGSAKNISRLDTDEDPRPSTSSSVSPSHKIRKCNSSSNIPLPQHSLGTAVEEEDSIESSDITLKEPNLNSIFHEMIDSFPTSNGEGGCIATTSKA